MIRSYAAIVCAVMLAVGLYGAGGRINAAAGASIETYGGRSFIAYVPSRPPSDRLRALVVVLHGGLGNAQRIEQRQSEVALNLDMLAERDGFVVAYLNGTPVTRFLGADKLGWNAGGGCCGLAASNGVDDIGYIKGAVEHLVTTYNIDGKRVFGLGHSNGAMMAQRVVCEIGLFAAIVPIAGPLNVDVATCPGARGRRVLAIHGADDANVPVAGGRGPKGVSGVSFKSEDRSRAILIGSGATYDLLVVAGAEHWLVSIDAGLQRLEHLTVQEKVTHFFGLSGGGR